MSPSASRSFPFPARSSFSLNKLELVLLLALLLYLDSLNNQFTLTWPGWMETAEWTVCCRITTPKDTSARSYKMEPVCPNFPSCGHFYQKNITDYSYTSDTELQVPSKRGTKRLVRLYYLGLSARQLRVMLSAHWFLFSSPLRFFPAVSLWPSLHLHQLLPRSETSCRSDGCWAGSIRKSNPGRLAHASRHTDASQIFPDKRTHRSSDALRPACLQSHRSASTLPNGFLSSSILLLLFSLCVTQNNKCSRPCETCM